MIIITNFTCNLVLILCYCKVNWIISTYEVTIGARVSQENQQKLIQRLLPNSY